MITFLIHLYNFALSSISVEYYSGEFLESDFTKFLQFLAILKQNWKLVHTYVQK